MEIFKIVAVGVVSAVLIVYLKHLNSELTMPLTVCCGILILLMTVSYVEEFLSVFSNIASISGIDGSVLKIILKIIALSYLIEFSTTLIEDFGLKSIADKVVFGGKILILILSAPIIENLITTVVGLL
ncbi:MAG: hypothetical protein E7360_02740 [Clostridiales bacterium]|nr:hypothetical protein [Clostridiales bacterium]